MVGGRLIRSFLLCPQRTQRAAPTPSASSPTLCGAGAPNSRKTRFDPSTPPLICPTLVSQSCGLYSELSTYCTLVGIIIALGVIAIGATTASAAGMVPFSGSYSGAVVWPSGGTPTFSGTGTASYLGQSTNQGYVVFTSATPSCAGGVPNDNYETLASNDGDSLLIVSHDVACPTGPYQYQGTGNWQVIGGTSRFKGASGGGTLAGNSNFANGTFSFQLTGSISQPSGD